MQPCARELDVDLVAPSLAGAPLRRLGQADGRLTAASQLELGRVALGRAGQTEGVIAAALRVQQEQVAVAVAEDHPDLRLCAALVAGRRERVEAQAGGGEQQPGP